ncbi:thiol-specific monooxygenase [Fusarium albosuccineum]|uniref:Thiol-specific monooxygenase n=1 Tax=Fusarium albosuccineum TaxID=1237068 RepID=A0A8H4KXG2_9HYPO|nr:thiol-specific monooxygenase [Fusarium albosuccineum]
MPHPSIPCLRDLVKNRADQPVNLPLNFPCETPKTPEVNSQRLRYAGTAAHEHLHSNLPPSVMAFTQEPIPEIVAERVLPQYGPIPVFRPREVIRRWIQDIFTKGGHEHLVEFNTSVELAEKETFDAVIVASGHYSLPHIPDIPGLVEYNDKFPGRIRHTKHYNTADEFKGKPSAIFGWAPFSHPHIESHSSISSIDPDTGRITFSDDAFLDDIDVVLFATGFAFNFPFLPNTKPVNGRIPGLYQHVFKSDDPSLAFIGMVTGGFGLRIFEWQAVAAARVFAGHAVLPSHEEMGAWEQARLIEKGDGPPFWALLPDFERHFEALRAIAGDPAAGTTGRVLPKYEHQWEETFWKLIHERIAWWEETARGKTR